jgi:hypothetical protein
MKRLNVYCIEPLEKRKEDFNSGAYLLSSHTPFNFNLQPEMFVLETSLFLNTRNSANPPNASFRIIGPDKASIKKEMCRVIDSLFDAVQN